MSILYFISADVDNDEAIPEGFSVCSFYTKVFLHLVLDVMYVMKRPPILHNQYIARQFPFMVIRGDIGHIGVEM